MCFFVYNVKYLLINYVKQVNIYIFTKKCAMRTIYFLFSFIHLMVFGFASGQNPVTQTSENGLVTTTFETPQGNVTVYMAKDLHKGDMISGTVVAAPSGKNEKAISKNQAVLNGFVVDFAGKETSLNKERDTWQLPEPDPRGFVDLILRNASGRELGRTPVAVSNVTRMRPAGGLSPEGFRIPSYMQAGQPSRIPGSFDGDFGSSSVTFDDQPTDLLAETPGELFLKAPEDMSGPTELELNEGDLTITGTTHVLDIEMSAGNTNLLRGETTPVYLQVDGLEGIEKEVPVLVTNLSPSTITLDGGNSQTIQIHPADVSPEGIWVRDFTVRATQSGSFSIVSQIVPEEPAGDQEADTTMEEMVPEEFGPDQVSAMPNEMNDFVLYNPSISFVYDEFNNDFGNLFTVIDYNLPRKYRFDPDRVTIARGNRQHFNGLRQGAGNRAAQTAQQVNGTENRNRRELRGTVGFKVYYGERDSYNCYWIYSDWFTWKTDEYYSNSWRTDRKLLDVLRFNNIKADLNGNIELTGTVSSGWGISPSISLPIPNLPGASIGVSVTPPSTSTLRASGTMSGEIAGYLDGKSLVMYMYYDDFHVEKAYRKYFFRFKQRYCNNSPVGPVLYETTTLEFWYQCTERRYFVDAYLEVAGITHGSTDAPQVHTRVETLAENQKITVQFQDCEEIQPGADADPAAFFEGVDGD